MNRPDEWAWAAQTLEQEQWLRDENAQREYQSWLDLINAQAAHKDNREPKQSH